MRVKAIKDIYGGFMIKDKEYEVLFKAKNNLYFIILGENNRTYAIHSSFVTIPIKPQSHKRWRKLFKLKGYKQNKKHKFWHKDKNAVFLPDKDYADNLGFHMLTQLRFEEADTCEICSGSGRENTNGWIHGCMSCCGTGKVGW